SSVRWPSNVAYAPPASNGDASTRDTCVSFGTPGTLSTTFFQVRPPSRLTCRLPSLLPTQTIPGTTGDSLIVTMLLNAAAPSCLDAIGGLPSTPMIGRSLRPMFRVRSCDITQVLPRSIDLKRRSPPRYTVDGLCGDRMNGVFQ